MTSNTKFIQCIETGKLIFHFTKTMWYSKAIEGYYLSTHVNGLWESGISNFEAHVARYPKEPTIIKSIYDLRFV